MFVFVGVCSQELEAEKEENARELKALLDAERERHFKSLHQQLDMVGHGLKPPCLFRLVHYFLPFEPACRLGFPFYPYLDCVLVRPFCRCSASRRGRLPPPPTRTAKRRLSRCCPSRVKQHCFHRVCCLWLTVRQSLACNPLPACALSIYESGFHCQSSVWVNGRFTVRGAICQWSCFADLCALAGALVMKSGNEFLALGSTAIDKQVRRSRSHCASHRVDSRGVRDLRRAPLPAIA